MNRGLVAGRDGQVVDVSAGARRFIPHLESRNKVKDIRRSKTAACAVNREHGLSADVVEIDVLHDGASPVGKVKKIQREELALIEDLMGTPAMDFSPVKSKSRSLARPPAPSLIICEIVMPSCPH